MPQIIASFAMFSATAEVGEAECQPRATAWLLLARAKHERKRGARRLVSGWKLQALELPEHAALDARIVKRRAPDAGARHRTTGRHAEADGERATERWIARRSR